MKTRKGQGVAKRPEGGNICHKETRWKPAWNETYKPWGTLVRIFSRVGQDQRFLGQVISSSRECKRRSTVGEKADKRLGSGTVKARDEAWREACDIFSF